MIATLLFIAPVLAQSSDALAPAHEQLIEVATTTVQTVNEDTKKQTQVEEATVKQPEEYTLDEAISLGLMVKRDDEQPKNDDTPPPPTPPAS